MKRRGPYGVLVEPTATGCALQLTLRGQQQLAAMSGDVVLVRGCDREWRGTYRGGGWIDVPVDASAFDDLDEVTVRRLL